MKAADVEVLVRDVPSGTILRLFFKNEDAVFIELRYLQGLVAANKVVLDPCDFAFLLAVAQSKNWGSRRETRHFIVTTTGEFDLEWFVDRMSRPLERLEVLSSS